MNGTCLLVIIMAYDVLGVVTTYKPKGFAYK